MTTKEPNGYKPTPLTREDLYDIVWKEPMLKTAEHYNVSSSYLARVCSRMNVPRPERGYWAKLAVGKAPKKPSLPEPGPGDELFWARDGEQLTVPAVLPRPPKKKRRRRTKSQSVPTGEHRLTAGAKEIFEAGRLSYSVPYLKPSKRLLIDLAVTKSGINKALSFANQLFNTLESYGYNVDLSPKNQRFGKSEIDVYEKPRQRAGYDYPDLWRPCRVTVVFIGTVAIGLTIIEMIEEEDARYVDGEYVKIKDYVPPKRARYSYFSESTHKHDFPTGRLRLLAYSPYHRVKWTQQWSETPKRDLSNKIKRIVKELEKAAPIIAERVAEGERQAEIEHQEWLVEQEKMRIEREERRREEATKESLNDLLQVISGWAEVNRIEQFFKEAEKQASSLNDQLNSEIRERLKLARNMIGNIDALEHFRAWESPDEKYDKRAKANHLFDYW
jgi:hypothetical protein